MSKTTTENHGAFTHVKGEIAWTIAQHRSPSEAIEMTTHLTEEDVGRFELLGLREECETARYWDHVGRGIVDVGFDAERVDDLNETRTETTGDFGRHEYLQSADLEAWTLVHPRHQWLMK